MGEQASHDGLVPLTVSDLPMAIEGGSDVQGHRNKLAVAPYLAGGGVLLAAAGVLILIFGPSSIMVAASGPTLREWILLNPYVLTILGVVASSGAGHVRRSGWEELHRYVAERYFLCDDEGRPVTNGGLTVGLADGGGLEIGYFMNDGSEESAQPESSRSGDYG
ncbi:hypothetical protein [Aquisalimonas asiatica]|uniref:Uncharacterized protein n=1 Tax=Aquisalimonas asiatica TaxID=406100 RepID=A0A1H8VI17_9GAMM|nr:hypothetical protein [Aquisalimonas asiatica]SEP15011.1 hypothetical protein SAMN04488052_11296 [Aquisalimonas asiatica]